MAELAAALGVDGVVTGSVGKFDQAYQVNISVVSSRDGRTLSAFSRKVNGSSAVLDALNDAADQMARDLSRALGRPPAPPHQPLAPERTSAPSTLRDWFSVPSGLGVAAGVGSTLFLLQANAAADQLRKAAGDPANNHLTLDAANTIRANGATSATLGYAFAAVAAAGIGIGAYCFFAGGPSQPVALRILPGPT